MSAAPAASEEHVAPVAVASGSEQVEDYGDIDFPIIEVEEDEDEPEPFDSASAVLGTLSPSIEGTSSSFSASSSSETASADHSMSPPPANGGTTPTTTKKHGFLGKIFKRHSDHHTSAEHGRRTENHGADEDEERHISERKERHRILEEAQKLAMELKASGAPRRHVTVIYNPVSGKGAAKRITAHIVVPILQICGLDYTIIETKYAGYATEFVRSLDCASTNAIIIAGGDGLVHEVITGYFEHPNQEEIKSIGVGIVPSGTANAMANTLHQHKSHSSTSLTGYATLAVCRGQVRAVDVLQVKTPKEKIYCLSVVGWGIAGAVARKAAKLRWIPGQKKARYDIAGFVMMIQDWPVLDRGLLSYPVIKVDEHGAPQTTWVRENLETVNFTASNLPKLGEDHPISKDITVDDGYLCLTSVGPEGGRKGVIKMALAMKRGIYLADQAGVKSWKLKEFILEPFGDSKHDFNVDGDPLPPTKLHVKVLNKALNIFVEPPRTHHHPAPSDGPLASAQQQAQPAPSEGEGQLRPRSASSLMSPSPSASDSPSVRSSIVSSYLPQVDIDEFEDDEGITSPDSHSETTSTPRIGTIVLGDEDELPCIDCGEDYFDLFERTQSDMPRIPTQQGSSSSGIISSSSLSRTLSPTSYNADEVSMLSGASTVTAGTSATTDTTDSSETSATVTHAHAHSHAHTETRSFIRWPKIHRPNSLYTREHLERKHILSLADALGRRLKEENAYQRHITVIYNPVSGRGAARRIVDHMVVPVLKLAGLVYTVVPTEYAGFATEFVQQIDVSETNGLIIAGGDGLVHEVITGYYEHKDQATIRKLPVGIVPSGTANAMANAIHQHKSHSSTSLTGYAALAVATGTARKVDVIEIVTPKETIRCLSVIGWGLAGAVARKADQMRWIPGQKKMRYDIAGFVTMMRDWPVLNRCKIRYAVTEPPSAPTGTATPSRTTSAATTSAPTPAASLPPTSSSSTAAPDARVWREEEFSLINMVASNLAKLGDDHPIYPDIRPDDGKLALVIVDGKVSRRGVAGMALAMKKGKYLGKAKKGVRSIITDEFYLEPSPECRTDFNIDGDPMPPCQIHVRCLRQDLTVFAEAGEGFDMFPAPVIPRRSSSMPWNETDADEKIPAIPIFEDDGDETFLETIHEEEAGGADGAVPVVGAAAAFSRSPSGRPGAVQDLSTATSGIIPAPKCHRPLFAKECSDRKLVMKEAEALAATIRASGAPARHFTVIYNPVTAKGVAKLIAQYIVVPIIQLCGFTADTVETKFAGFATEYITKLDCSTTNTLVVVGGDALLHEVVTGYFTHADQAAIRKLTVGVVPCGTTNSMARTAYEGAEDVNTCSLATGRATMAICRGEVQETDVLKCTIGGKEEVYAMSMVGWGISGAVARKAAKMRWLPGQKRTQYDVSALIAMIPDWPVVDKAKFSYPIVRRVNDTTERVWVERDISIVNLIATNLPQLGADYPILRHISQEDGLVGVVYIDDKATRGEVLRSAKAMKKGLYLAEQKGVWSVKTSEFRITPEACCKPHDFNIDGVPFAAGELHVQVMHRALPLITLPQDEVDSDSEPDSGVSTSSREGLLMEGGVVVSEEGFLPVEQEADDFFDLFDEQECSNHMHDESNTSPFGDLDAERRKRLFWPKIIPQMHSKADKERNKILREAQQLSAELHCTVTPAPLRRILIIYNPVSGQGIARRLVEHMVLPVLDICGLKYEVLRTEYAGHARRIMRELEDHKFDGIVVSGGDGLVHEVISGYYENTNKNIRKTPVGICPAGTANAMANYLHRHHSHTHTSLVGYGALAVARGTTRAVDVFSVETAKEKVHCLSVIGWGLAGAVARKAAQLRWIPGQKKARYDIAGFVTMLQDWPVINRAKFRYLTEEKGPDGVLHEVWKDEKLSLINMIATNLPKLGEDHPIFPDIAPDDGFMAVVVINEGVSRKGVVNLALKMKKGKYLGLQKGARSFKTREFILEPEPESTTDLLVDGDPLAPTTIHVKVLNKGLKLFAEPDPAAARAQAEAVKHPEKVSFV